MTIVTLYDVDKYRAAVSANDPDNAIRTWSTVRLQAVNTGSHRTGPDRRTRAAEIGALKRAIERATGYQLVLISKSYSETYGFMHASYFTYRIER